MGRPAQMVILTWFMEKQAGRYTYLKILLGKEIITHKTEVLSICKKIQPQHLDMLMVNKWKLCGHSNLLSLNTWYFAWQNTWKTCRVTSKINSNLYYNLGILWLNQNTSTKVIEQKSNCQQTKGPYKYIIMYGRIKSV